MRRRESDSLVVLGSDELGELTQIVIRESAPVPRLRRRRDERLPIAAALVAGAGALLALGYFLGRPSHAPTPRAIPAPVVIQPIQAPVVEPILVK